MLLGGYVPISAANGEQSAKARTCQEVLTNTPTAQSGIYELELPPQGLVHGEPTVICRETAVGGLCLLKLCGAMNNLATEMPCDRELAGLYGNWHW